MQSTITKPLAEFLALPNIEASPAWEFINGMPFIPLLRQRKTRI